MAGRILNIHVIKPFRYAGYDTIHQRSDKLFSEFPLKVVAFDPTDLCT